jgi:pyridoxal phosphate enzyme (YggS family)
LICDSGASIIFASLFSTDRRGIDYVTVSRAAIEKNLTEVRERMRAAARKAGRNPEEIELVAVTKTVGIEETLALYDFGVRDFGENRLQPAREKIERFPHEATWHMIGNVQRRKCPEIMRLFDKVDAVDRVAVAETFNKRCEESGREVPLPILVEVNVSDETSKHGFSPQELPEALDKIREMKYLRVDGLMTMAPFVENPEETRPFFARLRHLAEFHELPTLSMGMTNDFEVALEEGATQVRIGTALFKT